MRQGRMIDGPDPIERPTYGSLSATPPPAPPPPRRDRRPGRLLPWLLLALALAFAVGLIASPWFERTVRARLFGAPAPAAPDPLVARQAAAIRVLQARLDALQARLAEPAAPEGGRMARIETRLDSLQSNVGALGEKVEGAADGAAEGAAQVQGVLLATTLRRAVDAGQPLGALEPALRARYGGEYPGAVETLAIYGQRPVTLLRLRQDFAKVRGGLATGDAVGGGSWWTTLKASFADVIAVRRAGAVTADPAARAALAQQRLDAGDVGGAIDIVARLPATPAASAWLADARRWRGAQTALAQIEAAALVPPPVSTP